MMAATLLLPWQITGLFPYGIKKLIFGSLNTDSGQAGPAASINSEDPKVIIPEFQLKMVSFCIAQNRWFVYPDLYCTYE